MSLKLLTPTIEPVNNSPGILGHGQGIEYENGFYYYIVGKYSPKTAVVALKSESNYCGRVNGEKEYLIVAWDKSQNSFVLLEHHCYEVRRYLKKYIGKKPDEAITMRIAELAAIQANYDAAPKCRKCSHVVIRFNDDQKEDICSSCYDKGLNNED